MKKILLSVVLGVTVVAVAQTNTAAPAQGQSATPAQGQASAPAAQAQPPVIKDPAEYNAYVAAVGQKDNNAKISGLEAFLTQYPNSVMKNQALELLMGTYQQANNLKKTLETGQKLVASDTCNERGLALLAYYNRLLVQNAPANDPGVPSELADMKKYGQEGLDCLPKITDAELLKNKKQMEDIFKAALGIAALQAGDYPTAITNLHAVADDNPNDFSIVYPLALSYLKQTPPDYQNGVWFAARAAATAPAGAQAGVEKYAHGQFVKYRLEEEGWPEFIAAAKAGSAQVPIKPPLTPADQAHKMVTETAPDKMDFATWEFVLVNGSQADQDTVWNAIKGKAIAMNGTVISTEPTSFMIAGSSDDIDAKKADITLQFEDKVPVRLIPKDGASFDFQGEPASYTSNPFMMVLEKGRLVNAKPAAPAHKPTTTHKPAHQ